MSGSERRWTELASRNERVVHAADDGHGPAVSPWAELASDGERLADTPGPLASSCRGALTMRKVAGAA